MLGEEGAADLRQRAGAVLDGVSAQRAAELVIERLIKVVDAQEPENVPDGVCVLVAVVEEA